MNIIVSIKVEEGVQTPQHFKNMQFFSCYDPESLGHASKLWPYFQTLCLQRGFPGSSADKESTCNAGDPSLIPGSGRSSGEGIGYPLQYSWASLVAQMVKNPLAMQETWVRSLGKKIPWRRA